MNVKPEEMNRVLMPSTLISPPKLGERNLFEIDTGRERDDSRSVNSPDNWGKIF
jgi:hypothetical protein